MQLCSRFHLTKKNTAESFGLGEGGGGGQRRHRGRNVNYEVEVLQNKR